MISLRHKFLYLHPPKTGGTSIEQALIKYFEFIEDEPIKRGTHPLSDYIYQQVYNGQNTKHWNPRRYSNNFDTRGFFKFATVRNPWDRLVSYFFMLLRGSNKQVSWSEDAFYELVSQATNEIVWTKFSFYNTKSTDIDHFDFRSTCNFLLMNKSDDPQENLRSGEEVDFFIRYEDLKGGFDEACGRIGLYLSDAKCSKCGEPYENPIVLPHFGNGKRMENGEGYNKEHYSDYYTKELAEIVAENYKDDIEYFGYKFGE